MNTVIRAAKGHLAAYVRSMIDGWAATPIEVIEFWTGLIALLFGIILIFSPQLFVVNAAYRIMAKIPNWAWGGFAILSGIGQLLGTVNPRFQFIAEVSANLSFILWFFVSVGLAAVSITTGLAVYPVLDFLMLLILIRHSFDRKKR